MDPHTIWNLGFKRLGFGIWENGLLFPPNKVNILSTIANFAWFFQDFVDIQAMWIDRFAETLVQLARSARSRGRGRAPSSAPALHRSARPEAPLDAREHK